MWTVAVTLMNGSVQSFSDERRSGRELGDRAYRYEYEVDGTTEALSIFRTRMACTAYNAFEGFWEPDGPREEVGYFRAPTWDTVEGN